MPAQRGQTFISVIIAMAVLLILGHAIFTLITASYELVSFTRSRTTAKHIAQEKMELIRNLAYDEVGTHGGIPAGTLAQEETVTRNGNAYTVSTSIIFVDDPYDGLSPDDSNPTDYKRVRIEVSWEGIAASRANPVTFMTDISSTTNNNEGGGTLSVLVFDANGLPVQAADVHITATSTDPQIDAIYQTDGTGEIIIPGMPICSACYFIEVTKDGYSSERTYSTAEIANPVKPYQSVLLGDLTEISFAIDRLGSLTVNTHGSRDDGYPPLPGASFNLLGEKLIGTDTLGSPVYKFSQNFTTDASGTLLVEDLEWDNYEITPSSYDLAGSSPINPFLLSPGENQEISVTLYPESDHSLLAAITDPADNPIASVSATLKNSDGTEVETITTGLEGFPDWGHAFFAGLGEAVYILTATASGFVDRNVNISVSGNSIERIIMEQI